MDVFLKERYLCFSFIQDICPTKNRDFQNRLTAYKPGPQSEVYIMINKHNFPNANHKHDRNQQPI